jgi:hypothetical protein
MSEVEPWKANLQANRTAESPYKDILLLIDGEGSLRCEKCCDDDTFADRMAESLRLRMARSPAKANDVSTGLQGNLCEFCVWELGECHWQIYARSRTWPANARTPWRHRPNSGVDIVAIDESAETVYFIEVKSSSGDGVQAISSTDDSLKADFRHLFEGSLDLRIWESVDPVVASLIEDGNRDLAGNVVDCIGDTPSECGGVHLIGVLVSNGGDRPRSRDARKRAFERLHGWLLEQGWRKDQCEYRSVELCNFRRWLIRLIQKVAE